MTGCDALPRSPSATIAEIDRLLAVQSALRSLGDRLMALLGDDFPDSARAVAMLEATFDRECEHKLLRAYEPGPAGPPLA